MTMSVLPELEEFLQDATENSTMLNRYCRDTTSCLISQQVRLPVIFDVAAALLLDALKLIKF